MTAICSLFFVSCESLGNKEDSISVSIRKAVVNSEAGQQFVNVQCEGDWTLAIVSENAEVDWASLSVTEGTGNKSNVVLKYEANNTDSIRDLKLILDNGSKWAECTLRQYAPGQESEEDLEVGGEVDVTKTDWLELPKMEDPALGYYTHSFDLGGKKYRNYSFGWSQKDFVALWVAYPLCSVYTNKKVDRTNAWAYDPLLGRGYSSAPFGGYGGSYARGHQLPSADRLCCYEANAQTFYGTNMTPQLNGHNEGIWSSMENQIRSWANGSDTTYVVTGCIVDSSCSKTEDSDGNTMTIPKAYYKAVIIYNPHSTHGVWNAVAFYTEHRSYSGVSIEDLVVSIDWLEEKTGLDLFANLPKKIGESQAAALEASTKIWW